MLVKILSWLILLAIAVGVIWLLVILIPIVLPIIGTIAVIAYAVWFCNGPRIK